MMPCLGNRLGQGAFVDWQDGWVQRLCQPIPLFSFQTWLEVSFFLEASKSAPSQFSPFGPWCIHLTPMRPHCMCFMHRLLHHLQRCSGGHQVIGCETMTPGPRAVVFPSGHWLSKEHHVPRVGKIDCCLHFWERIPPSDSEFRNDCKFKVTFLNRAQHGPAKKALESCMPTDAPQNVWPLLHLCMDRDIFAIPTRCCSSFHMY